MPQARIMSMRDISNALVNMSSAVDAEEQGNVEIDELRRMKKKLVDYDPTLAEWTDQLVMERRGGRPYFRHPMLPNRGYDRFQSSGGHPGLLNAILEAKGSMGDGAQPPQSVATTSAAAAAANAATHAAANSAAVAAAANPVLANAAAADPREDRSPPREENRPQRSALLTDDQVDESVQAVGRLVRHNQALRAQLARLTAELADRDEWIDQMTSFQQAQNEKLKRKRDP